MRRRDVLKLSLPVLSLALLILSLAIAKAFEITNLRAVITASGIILCVLVALNWLVLAYNKSGHKAEIQSILDQLHGLVAPTGLPWLFRDRELAKAESESRGNSIWIISPDLKNVIEKSEIREAVRSNIKRGITYTYIVPDSDKVNGILPGLKALAKSSPKRLNIISLDKEEFRVLSVTHIAILNATMVGDQQPDVFVELPIEEAGGQRIRGYWIKVSQSAASGMTGRFRRVIENRRRVG